MINNIIMYMKKITHFWLAEKQKHSLTTPMQITKDAYTISKFYWSWLSMMFFYIHYKKSSNMIPLAIWYDKHF